MAKRKLQDQQARDRIQKDALDSNMVVMAGAGAGKTHALVERMVNYVRTVSPEIDRIAAITFTRKAAGEMRGRFLLRLQEQLGKARGQEVERLQLALDRVVFYRHDSFLLRTVVAGAAGGGGYSA
jgi:ATP-dependent helicase/nuclease subunit A